MIMGIGVDMVSEARVARSIKRPGFLEKVYGPAERALLENRGMRPQTAAANFAAKEAFGKALGTGLLREFALCEAEALRDENGAPYFSFSGRAAALMQARWWAPFPPLARDRSACRLWTRKSSSLPRPLWCWSGARHRPP